MRSTPKEYLDRIKELEEIHQDANVQINDLTVQLKTLSGGLHGTWFLISAVWKTISILIWFVFLWLLLCILSWSIMLPMLLLFDSTWDDMCNTITIYAVLLFAVVNSINFENMFCPYRSLWGGTYRIESVETPVNTTWDPGPWIPSPHTWNGTGPS